jgi:hypothetical protein
MTVVDIIAATTITSTWVGLGGDLPQHGRARAFYRNGDNPQAVSFDDSKGIWFDHRDHFGGGVLDLVQHVLGCDRGSAIRWLANFTGQRLDNHTFTPSERREYAQRRTQAQQLARAVSDFERGLELCLERRQEDAGALIPWLLSLGLNELGEILASAARGLAMLRKADSDSLVALYRKLPEAVRGPFRDAGRLDRENAEAVTRAIVTMLAAVPRDKEPAA